LLDNCEDVVLTLVLVFGLGMGGGGWGCAATVEVEEEEVVVDPGAPDCCLAVVVVAEADMTNEVGALDGLAVVVAGADMTNEGAGVESGVGAGGVLTGAGIVKGVAAAVVDRGAGASALKVTLVVAGLISSHSMSSPEVAGSTSL